MNALMRNIDTMIKDGVIRFEPYSWCFKMVDVSITSDIFSDSPFVISIPRNKWDCNPDRAVADELSELILNEEVDLIKRKGSVCYEEDKTGSSED